MNINMIVGLVALVAVVGGVSWYATNRPAQIPEEEVGTISEGSTVGTFAELMARGGSWTCDVAVTVPASPAEGTVYISGDEVRADVVARPAVLGGTEVSAHMIQTDGYLYSWTDMFPQGVKVAVEGTAAAQAAAQGQGIDPNTEVEYSCEPWSVDAGMFAIPSTVTFVEFSGQGSFAPIPQ